MTWKRSARTFLAAICKFKALITSLTQHKSLILLRKVLLDASEDILQTVIDYNILPILISHIKNTSQPHLMLESAWCIANLCTGNESHIRSLTSKGLLEALPIILRSNYLRIFEQGAWAVANISADHDFFR